MNETVLPRPAAVEAPKTGLVVPRRKTSQALRGYALLTLLIVAGYLLREYSPITPEAGIGYWLGIIGGSMMLSLLIYPLRKRIRMKRTRA